MHPLLHSTVKSPTPLHCFISLLHYTVTPLPHSTITPLPLSTVMPPTPIHYYTPALLHYAVTPSIVLHCHNHYPTVWCWCVSILGHSLAVTHFPVGAVASCKDEASYQIAQCFSAWPFQEEVCTKLEATHICVAKAMATCPEEASLRIELELVNETIMDEYQKMGCDGNFTIPVMPSNSPLPSVSSTYSPILTFSPTSPTPMSS